MRFPLFFFKKKILQIGVAHYLIILISGFLLFYFMCFLGLKFIMLASPVILISLLYPISICIKNKTFSVRSIPFLKLFLISFVWAYVTVLLPLLYNGAVLSIDVLNIFFQRILFIIAISIPFDIRDIEIDKIKTLPNTIGVMWAKIFSFGCLFLVEILLIIGLIFSLIQMHDFIALFLSILLSAIIILLTHKKNSYFFYGIFVEGLSIIMCLFVLISNFIYSYG